MQRPSESTATTDSSARADVLVSRGAPLLRTGIYLEPFALRALGIVRADEALIEHAIARFEAMALDWHADQTRRLST